MQVEWDPTRQGTSPTCTEFRGFSRAARGCLGVTELGSKGVLFGSLILPSALVDNIPSPCSACVTSIIFFFKTRSWAWARSNLGQKYTALGTLHGLQTRLLYYWRWGPFMVTKRRVFTAYWMAIVISNAVEKTFTDYEQFGAHWFYFCESDYLMDW